IQSTISKGRITEIDTQAAERLPGVLAILTHRNAPRLHPVTPTQGGGPSGQSPGVELMLRDDRIHFFGQHIGIAVADSFERAMEAAALVHVSYAPEPAATDLEAHVAQAVSPKQQLKGRYAIDSRLGDPEA